MSRRKIEGQITILFERDGLRIDVHDRISGLMIVSADVAGPETLKALARQGMVDCALTVYHTGAPIGYVCEVKTEEISFKLAPKNKNFKQSKTGLLAVVGPFCVEGWEPVRGWGDHADWNNRHNNISKGAGTADTYRVHFTRYVDPHTGEPWLRPLDPDTLTEGD